MQPAHWIIITVIIAWAAVMIASSRQATEKERLKHLERLAMIDKGLPLPPDAPMASAIGSLLAGTYTEDPRERERKRLDGIRFLGMLTIAAGIAIFFLLVVLGEWTGAVAIGGMMAIIGTGLIVTTMRALRVRQRDPG